MPPARARKSSTSSGRRERARSRYLGVEVAGEPVPSLAPSRWTAWLHESLLRSGARTVGFRLIRADGPRVIVRVGARESWAARTAWNLPEGPDARPALRTVRTWGTLVGAKAWVGGRPRPAPGAGERARLLR